VKRREFIATGVAALSASTARPVRAQPAAAPAPAQSQVKPASRAEATAIIAQARKIVTPDGVQRREKVRIGGIEQWGSRSVMWTGGIRCSCTSTAVQATSRSR